MNNRERQDAILHYRDYDRMPVVHFGFWGETLDKWVEEGHLTREEVTHAGDGSEKERAFCNKLGFDFNYYTTIGGHNGLKPPIESKVLGMTDDGFQKVLNGNGVIELHRGDAGSIPAEIGYLLEDKASWEEHFKHRMQYDEERVNSARFENFPYKKKADREFALGLHFGSMLGNVRNMLGFEGVSYLYADDPDTFQEIIDANADLSYKVAEKMLAQGIEFDFCHFWEDICFKNGPLISPKVFEPVCGPWYRKFGELAAKHGIDIVSLDCDGCIDALIPTWINNGVNTMFPIEVGTWEASIAPWREKFGKDLRGVGGMDKKVFAYDYKAIDEEIERLKPLVALGGFIPCPDHRIAPDAKWENVQYYCEQFRKAFGR